MYDPQIICEEHVAARKHHRCFHCYRSIAPGTKHRRSVLKFDYVYALRFHPDCEALWDMYSTEANVSPRDYDDGYPPIYDDWRDSGDFDQLCDQYRGFFPHAVSRLEFTARRASR